MLCDCSGSMLLVGIVGVSERDVGSGDMSGVIHVCVCMCLCVCVHVDFVSV